MVTAMSMPNFLQVHEPDAETVTASTLPGTDRHGGLRGDDMEGELQMNGLGSTARVPGADSWPAPGGHEPLSPRLSAGYAMHSSAQSSV